MIDYYLLRAVVSSCIQTKTAASFSEVISCAFFGSSWSSDTALQVTCIVTRQMLSKFILFGCCYLFLPHSRVCFSFPTLSFLVSHPWGKKHKCVSTMGKRPSGPVSQVFSVTFEGIDSLHFQFHTATSQTHSLKERLWEVSQPFPHFQKECGALHAFCLELKMHMSIKLAANLGPTAQ